MSCHIICVSIWNQSLPGALSDLEWDDFSIASVLAVFGCRSISSYCTISPMNDLPSTYREHCSAQTRSWMLQHHDSVAQMSCRHSIWSQSLPGALPVSDFERYDRQLFQMWKLFTTFVSRASRLLSTTIYCEEKNVQFKGVLKKTGVVWIQLPRCLISAVDACILLEHSATFIAWNFD